MTETTTCPTCGAPVNILGTLFDNKANDGHYYHDECYQALKTKGKLPPKKTYTCDECKTGIIGGYNCFPQPIIADGKRKGEIYLHGGCLHARMMRAHDLGPNGDELSNSQKFRR